jgi:hypothetical protein
VPLFLDVETELYIYIYIYIYIYMLKPRGSGPVFLDVETELLSPVLELEPLFEAVEPDEARHRISVVCTKCQRV